MSNASSEQWAAALAAWSALDEGQRMIALGYLASGSPQVMTEAAAAAVSLTAPGPARGGPASGRDLGRVNEMIACLTFRQGRDVLYALAAGDPALVLAAITVTP